MTDIRITASNAQLLRTGEPKVAISAANIQCLRKPGQSTAIISAYNLQIARARAALYIEPAHDPLIYAGKTPFLASFVDKSRGNNISPKNLNWDIFDPVEAPHSLFLGSDGLTVNCVDGAAAMSGGIQSRFYVDGDFDVMIDTLITNGPAEDAFAWYLGIEGETTGRIEFNGAHWYSRSRFHIYENDVQKDWWDWGGSSKSAQMRIVRSGNNFSYYYEVDNVGWRLRSTRALTVSNRVFFRVKAYYNSANYPAEIGKVHSFAIKSAAIAGFGNFYPATKVMTFTGYAPVLSAIRENQVNIPTGTVNFTGESFALIDHTVPIGNATLAFTGQSPDPGVGYMIDTDGSLYTFTGYEPTLETTSTNYDETLGMLSISIEN